MRPMKAGHMLIIGLLASLELAIKAPVSRAELLVTADCQKIQIEKFTSRNGSNSIFLATDSIQADANGIKADGCVGTYRIKVYLPCRTMEGIYFMQENGEYKLTPAPWQMNGGAAAEKACSKYYF